MPESLPFIHLESARFPVLPGEDEELINEGTYGKALALYLQERLRERGYDVPFICCEDWGWWVEVAGQPATSGAQVYATASLPESHELCVAVAPQPGRRWSWSRFRFVDATDVAEKLFATVFEILDSDPEVTIRGTPSEFPLT